MLAIVLWDDISDNGPTTLVGGALAFDKLAMFMTITICLGVLLVSILTDEYLQDTPNQGPEVYALYLVAAIGGIVMASANDLIVLFLGLETLSLALYVLAASNRRSRQSAESGIKYFVLGGFASAFFLYGIALVYGATGSTNISEMVAALQTSIDPLSDDTLALAGIALLIVGLGFKVAAAPFHVWVPDVYQGAPTPVTSFMASVGKAAAFAAMIRVLVVALPFYKDDWRPIIWVLSPAHAARRLDPRRRADQREADARLLLDQPRRVHPGGDGGSRLRSGHLRSRAGGPVGRAVPDPVLGDRDRLVRGRHGRVARSTAATRTSIPSPGSPSSQPVLALGFTVLLLAQAGIPFTSGFIAKFGVIQAAVEVESYALAVIAMVCAVIAAFLYLRIMVSMWVGDSTGDASDGDAAGGKVAVPFSMGVVITLSVAFTLVLGVLPGWLIDAADQVTQYAR